ncbi:hypothetical protein PIB30_059108 [Stylosanthes scabra]|uniref:Uncharacterized protein n=1 Tax=Stylosanthes scabra TaxID=79078 RepID=A0ABU6YHM0_9FABA|nr:hypothetical protein [Stylosanthes scabra]
MEKASTSDHEIKSCSQFLEDTAAGKELEEEGWGPWLRADQVGNSKDKGDQEEVQSSRRVIAIQKTPHKDKGGLADSSSKCGERSNENFLPSPKLKEGLFSFGSFDDSLNKGTKRRQSLKQLARKGGGFKQVVGVKRSSGGSGENSVLKKCCQSENEQPEEGQGVTS